MFSSERLRIVGLMSGTSVDSIDAVLCDVFPRETGKLGVEILDFQEKPVASDLRKKIFHAFEDPSGGVSLLCSLNFEIGEAFAEAANELIEKWGGDRNTINAIASHGQTVYHIAPHMVTKDSKQRASTLQIGEAAVIAERVKLPVIADFRVADMAAGGNGAPLVPFADYHLFSSETEGIIVHNLGGIANLTWLPAGGSPSDVIAFDTGPANMIIDALVAHFYPSETFDKDGLHGRNGSINEKLLSEWMSVPYIDAKPPKSTGRELFGVNFALRSVENYPQISADDFIATATEFTALSFQRNIDLHISPKGTIDVVYIAGGGARNPFLMERFLIHSETGKTKVFKLDEAGFSSQMRECVGFAMMGYARLKNMSSNLPGVTGANKSCLLGKISLPF